ncbi:MAG: DUF2306 domain-containing protein [Bacteroidota bacterium]
MQALKIIGIVLLVSISLFMLVWMPDHFSFLGEQASIRWGYRLGLGLHVFAAGLALIAGPILFWARFREQPLAFHQPLGIAYRLSCLLAGLSGLFFMAFARIEFLEVICFLFLNLFWLLTILMAIQKGKAGDLAANRRWLLRSFSLTFSVVTLRILLFFFFNESDSTIHPIVFWLAWVPNLFFTELYICRELKAAQKATA